MRELLKDTDTQSRLVIDGNGDIASNSSILCFSFEITLKCWMNSHKKQMLAFLSPCLLGEKKFAAAAQRQNHCLQVG